MIVGQETNSWTGEIGEKSIDQLMNKYEDFFGNGKCFRYGGQYWNAVKSYSEAFKSKYDKANVQLIWNNILKVGKNEGKGKPKKEIIKIQQEYFPVFQKELEILKPDVLIFFTGPKYDKYLRSNWDDITFDQIDKYPIRELAKVSSKYLPKNSFRTYHPSYIYRKGKQYFHNVQNTIINNVLV